MVKMIKSLLFFSLFSLLVLSGVYSRIIFNLICTYMV